MTSDWKTGQGFVKVNFNFTLAPKRVRAEMRSAITRITERLKAEAKANAPVSPTQRQKNSTLVRRRRSRTRMAPGGLEKSIEWKADARGGCIFVPRNSPAGAYAHYIHDMKDVLWFKRGLGTQRKGERADELFIERAIEDNEDKITRKLEAALERGLHGN